jgi:hypothetical protein
MAQQGGLPLAAVFGQELAREEAGRQERKEMVAERKWADKEHVQRSPESAWGLCACSFPGLGILHGGCSSPTFPICWSDAEQNVSHEKMKAMRRKEFDRRLENLRW